MSLCAFDGCEKSAICRGICRSHYNKLSKTGQLVKLTMPTTVERFWSKIDKTGDCWLWTAGTHKGYGIFYPTKLEHVQAHRYAYELLVEPVPDGLELDHLCHTRDVSCEGGCDCIHRRCVNPTHLEPVTHLENVRRGRPTGRKVLVTHCPNGHEYAATNVYRYPSGARSCRLCRAESRRKFNLKTERT